MTRDTVFLDTPAIRAMSVIVSLALPPLGPLPAPLPDLSCSRGRSGFALGSGIDVPGRFAARDSNRQWRVKALF
jgi:hypothetical protein